MAQLIVSMNLSLDGYIEAQGQDDGSWLRIDEAVHRAFNELAASAESVLYGLEVNEVISERPDAAGDATKPALERVRAIWIEKLRWCSRRASTRARSRARSTERPGRVDRGVSPGARRPDAGASASIFGIWSDERRRRFDARALRHDFATRHWLRD